MEGKTMEGHTKGPWFLDTLSDGSMIIQPREGFSICPVHPRDGFEQDIPNFKLIAAAPELLEACKLLLTHLEFMGADHLSMGTARAAIAKTTLDK
jgi:hypothetical protein